MSFCNLRLKLTNLGSIWILRGLYVQMLTYLKNTMLTNIWVAFVYQSQRHIAVWTLVNEFLKHGNQFVNFFQNILGHNYYYAIQFRAPLCKALNIPVTQSLFMSDYSNRIADKVGFKVDSQYTMDDMNKIYPKIQFNDFDSKLFAAKTWDLQKTDA